MLTSPIHSVEGSQLIVDSVEVSLEGSLFWPNLGSFSAKQYQRGVSIPAEGTTSSKARPTPKPLVTQH